MFRWNKSSRLESNPCRAEQRKMADLGADVVKVESENGMTQEYGPPLKDVDGNDSDADILLHVIEIKNL